MALALSGGGDSVALMLLLAGWAKKHHSEVYALIVDHGLRPEAHKEAKRAARWAKAAGLKPHVLSWRGAKPKRNIEDAARNARYRLMGEWCEAHAVFTLLVAHTRDDQAETFLLRLGRGSGVDGLSAMRIKAPFPLPGFSGLELVRPLLDFGRDELRAFLKVHKAEWIEDPMNADPRFFRTKVRALLPQLELAGIPKHRIAAAAAHIGRAREALDRETETMLSLHARFDASGFALVDAHALLSAPREIGLRVLVKALMIVSGEAYRPRLEGLELVFDSFKGKDGAARTLHGCKIGFAPKRLQEFGARTLLIQREAARKNPSPRRAASEKAHFSARNGGLTVS